MCAAVVAQAGGEPPRKRARTTDHPGLVRHKSLWYDDGNIVLHAGCYIFKVHRSLLSRHSKIFRDLFELSHPGVGQDDQIDGVPVVDLQDSASDLAQSLQLIYDGSSLFKVNAKPLWAVVRSALRLGQKYEVEGLRKEATHFLEKFLPEDIHSWDNVTKDPPFRYTADDLLSIAKTTRGMPALHVRALYKCTQLPTVALLRGVEGAPEDEQYLGRTTVALCIDARRWLSKQRRRIYEACLTVEIPARKQMACRSGKGCDIYIITPLRPALGIEDCGYDPLAATDPLIATIQSWESMRNLDSICNFCREDMNAS